ncbi:MAG: TlpA disulfide reductase family protein [Bryobacter sp.]|nr:TlpA disulfide reductase family protein [Bryobacter sp.]
MNRRDLLLSLPLAAHTVSHPLRAAANSYSSAKPDFTLNLPAGQKISVSQFRGKVVVLEFFKTTCPHCQQSMPRIQKAYQEFGSKGFQPLAVAVDQYPAAVVAEFVKRYGITFPTGWAEIEPICDFLEIKPQNFYVPTMVSFTRSGKVHARHLGGESFFNMEEANLRNEIEFLLNQKGAAR